MAAFTLEQTCCNLGVESRVASTSTATRSARLVPAAAVRSFSSKNVLTKNTQVFLGRKKAAGTKYSAVVYAEGTTDSVTGAQRECVDSDFLALGIAHCFAKNDDGKLEDAFVIEPISAGTLESMDCGAVTSYLSVTGTTLGDAKKQDMSELPETFQTANFGEDFNFRCECVTRTWLRPYVLDSTNRDIVPVGAVRDDWNFSVQNHKRILNAVNVVSDSDNVKQDMSIDVYGREAEEEEDLNAEIEKLSNA